MQVDNSFGSANLSTASSELLVTKMRQRPFVHQPWQPFLLLSRPECKAPLCINLDNHLFCFPELKAPLAYHEIVSKPLCVEVNGNLAGRGKSEKVANALR